MQPEKIKKILRTEIKEISGLGEHIGNDFDKEIIHDFRVAVKALRSFLRLLRIDSNNDHLKIPKKFKYLYHTSGAIRDAQLESEKLINKQLLLPAYTDHLHQNINREMHEWQKHFKKKYFVN